MMMTFEQVMAAIDECDAQITANRQEMVEMTQQRDEIQRRLTDISNVLDNLDKIREALDAVRLILVTKGDG